MTLITNELVVLLLVLFISIFQQSVLLLLNSKVRPSDRLTVLVSSLQDSSSDVTTSTELIDQLGE